jgi:hypothetical protein
VGGAGGSAGGGAAADLWGELLRAEGAREVVAEEAASVLDALVRDVLWRAADAAAEAVPTPPPPLLPLPPLPLPPLLPSLPPLLPSLPPLRERAEALAPRLSEEERLVLARLPDALAQMARGDGKVESEAEGEAGPAAAPRGGVAVARVAAVPGVRDGAQRLLEEALVRQDPQARATVERVVSGLRTRLRTRLEAAGADGAAAEAVAALVRVPW